MSGSLWSNGNHSYHGTNDKFLEESLSTNSLLLIKPSSLNLIIGQESKFADGSKRKVREKFRFNEIDYEFVVAGPWLKPNLSQETTEHVR